MFSITRYSLLASSLAAAVALGLAACSPGAPPATEASTQAAQALENAPEGPFTYETYNEILQTYVDEKGLVDYAALKENRAGLDRFIASMGAIDPAEFETWSSDERLAFWMNAYNAITLKYIIDHYPISKGGIISGLRFPANSIRQIDGVWTKLTTRVVGKERTLDAIEHDILRVEFNEPRLHAAIVCAAIGCPPLRREALVAERLDEQLDDQSRKFLGVDHRFRIDRENDVVRLSAILDWFGKDFVGVYNTEGQVTGHGEQENAVLDYARRYVSEEDAQYILNEDYSVDFLDYDWSLNEQP